MTDTAAALGVTAVPNPSVISGDPEADWFVMQQLQGGLRVVTAVGVFESSVRYIVDSKAMRKVGPDDNVVAMVSSDTGDGAVLTAHGRQLIQLH